MLRAQPLLGALLFTLFIGASPGNPQIERFVFDQERLFDAQQEQRFDSLFRGHEARTTNEIALLTTRDFRGREDLRTYAAEFGDSLGVGKHGKNNGVVIAFSEEQREVFIAAGVGLEELLGEDQWQGIVDSVMLPRFKAGEYFEGLWDGSVAVVQVLERPENLVK